MVELVVNQFSWPSLIRLSFGCFKHPFFSSAPFMRNMKIPCILLIASSEKLFNYASLNFSYSTLLSNVLKIFNQKNIFAVLLKMDVWPASTKQNCRVAIVGVTSCLWLWGLPLGLKSILPIECMFRIMTLQNNVLLSHTLNFLYIRKSAYIITQSNEKWQLNCAKYYITMYIASSKWD